MNPIIEKLLGAFTGGMGGRVMDIVDRQFPGKLSPQEKAELKLAFDRLEHEQEKELNKAAQEASEALNRRVSEYEGTAADIKSMFVVGPLIILIRSMFRPLASYTTIYLDFVYFTSGGAKFPEGSDGLLLAINLIVLGFWFGERTIKNLMPLFMAWMDKRQP